MRTVLRGCTIGMFAVSVLVSMPATAEITANFRAQAIDGGCRVDDEEGPTQGDPDRIYRVAIFDSTATANGCVDGCTSDDGNPATADARSSDFCNDNSGCGAWNFTDTTVSKVVPGRSLVYFYFGLFDNDADATDLNGDHWFGTGLKRTNRTDLNNNNAPYKPDSPINTMCGGDVEKGGHAGNFDVTYSVWFTDDTGPDLSASRPSNRDDTLDDVHDNDTSLQFRWGAATDDDSGIKTGEYKFQLYDVTAGQSVTSLGDAPSNRVLDICASGCDYAYTPVHGHTYRVRVRATNGNYPEIDNPTTAWSAYSQDITVDLVDPVATISAPSPGDWFNGDFTVDFDDSDDGVGLDSAACEWQVSAGAVTMPWATRACDGTRTVTVGTTGDCNAEGADVCVVETRNADEARRTSTVGTRAFGIDWTEDIVGLVSAFTQQGGMPIAANGWTNDRDPYFSWAASTSTSPIAGYSWALDQSPDCGSTEIPGTGPFSVQLTVGRLTDGVHEFQVRAIDEAGNCGPVTTRTVQVDATAESVTNLRAQNGAGMAIPPQTWQQENAPTMLWDAPASASPIAGYSFGTGAATDCTIDGMQTSASIGPLPDGTTSFWVRAVDAAGNCGPAATFEIDVDTTPDTVPGLRAFDQQGGAPIVSGVAQDDTDPWLEWDQPLSTAPIAGFSYGTAMPADCSIDTISRNAQLSGLPMGTTTFWVSAIDEAGNCGPPATFDIVVDIASCGDGTVDPGEECDDANTDQDDDCIACQDAECGDGYVWTGNEACDQGDDNSDTEPNACRTDCTDPRCGDGVVDTGETCDEGDQNSDEAGATCRTNCALASCGDGVVNPGEECDEGANNDDNAIDGCRTNCALAFCGDGVIDTGETCDDGAANDDFTPDACRDNCARPACGDGTVDTGEMCDDGGNNSDDAPDACRTTCVPAFCGDGIVDSDEACELGDVQGDLICLDDCQFGAPPEEPDMGIDAGDMGSPDMGAPETDMGGGDSNNVTGGGNNGTDDAGTGSADMGAPGADVGPDASEPDLVESGVGGCCAQVPSRAPSQWPLVGLLVLVMGGLRRRRRR